MFENVQHCEVVNYDIASLRRQDIGFFVFLMYYFHRVIIFLTCHQKVLTLFEQKGPLTVSRKGPSLADISDW